MRMAQLAHASPQAIPLEQTKHNISLLQSLNILMYPFSEEIPKRAYVCRLPKKPSMQRELCSSWSILDQPLASTTCTSFACCCRSGRCIMMSPCICNNSFRKAWMNSKFEFNANSDLTILSKLLMAASSVSLLSTPRTCRPRCIAHMV